jgi:hypothetical protein
VVRKAAGRYYELEDEKLRAMAAKLAKGAAESDVVSAHSGYLDKYQPQPGWRPTPPRATSVTGGGQPVFELYFEGRQ